MNGKKKYANSLVFEPYSTSVKPKQITVIIAILFQPRETNRNTGRKNNRFKCFGENISFSSFGFFDA